ncbi:MmcQ/YjbR family DNA-binding protein [Sphaerisporangium rhizosphaerae]|uniref:MmcQ/YjbR family DNA-binding protein n=1 Tax=Sphaerisporangium rhizosphaerae TaxID=2269375 RepID=A0ABW2P6J1_9ACTN
MTTEDERTITVEDVRRVAMSLARTEEALVRDHVKFRVRGIVYASISPDETLMGFGFPKEERAALVASEPEKFLMPLPSDERYQWVRARLSALGHDEMRELVTDAWRMVVPKFLVRAHDERQARP